MTYNTTLVQLMSSIRFLSLSIICCLLLSKANAMISTPKPKPALKIPPPLLSLTPDTWAYDTMSRRVNEEILQRTYEENIDEASFRAVVDGFNALRKELENAATNKLNYLPDIDYEEKLSEAEKLERTQWRVILQEYIVKDDTWLSAPWCVTEFYVYRKLMDAIGYFDPSSPGYRYDPFYKEKRKGLESSVASAESVMEKIVGLPATKEGIALATAFALWGNKMDLSIWPTSTAEGLKEAFNKIILSSTDNLLHDDTSILTSHCEKLRSSGGGNVDIIVDNAGFELVVDLALADHLIASGIASTVTFQLKAHPTFVSDALEKDLLETVSYYATLDSKSNPNCCAAGERWQRYIDEGKWICNEDFFWVQPLPMWEMHDDIFNDIENRCDLAFVKGDANYRRLLGDRYWDYSVPFEQVVGAYFPCPVCALRTLKAEVGCGMDTSQVERAKSLDDQWLVNGRFGVVHFGKGVGKHSQFTS